MLISTIAQHIEGWIHFHFMSRCRMVAKSFLVCVWNDNLSNKFFC